MNLNFGRTSGPPDGSGKASGNPITDFPSAKTSHFFTGIFVINPIPYEGGLSPLPPELVDPELDLPEDLFWDDEY